MDKKTDITKLDLPKDLKKLSLSQCEELCEDIRKILISTVSKTGGHLASNLGTVELTMAIHRVFDSPGDKIVWDVGHQAYTHKILTGRLDRMSTLRQENGLSGFCRPDESEHDAFISGHSSTSVSAALGIAAAMKLSGDNVHHAIAVVGDGASTGGELYEGLNNAGKSDTNIIVILNYNEMSISKNVGAMAKYLSTMRTKDTYKATKGRVQRVLDATPLVGRPIENAIRSSKNAVKNMLIHSTMFEDLGFEFIGPLNGHDLADLERVLSAAKKMHKPVFIHVNTVKGKGYEPAEENPGEFHGVGSFEIATGNPDVVTSDSFSSVMGRHLCKLAQTNKKICAVTAAMKYGTGLQYFYKSYPKRFFDVGIAEEHAVTFCGGLASMGYVPVFAVYSTFLQRSYDQLIHDLSIMGSHAVICVDRAGIVGDDGETHQGLFDVNFLSTIPGVTVFSPSIYSELEACLEKAVSEVEGVAVVRYPRGADRSPRSKPETELCYENNGSSVLAVTYGRITNNMYKAKAILEAQGVKVDTLSLVRILPITEEPLEIMKKYDKVIFFEEACALGCLGEKYQARLGNVEVHAIDGFVHHGKPAALLDEQGLSAEKMAQTILRSMKNGTEA